MDIEKRPRLASVADDKKGKAYRSGPRRVSVRGKKATMADQSAQLSRRRPDTSTTRVLGLLDLFTLENPVWTAEMLVDQLGLARATVYRYLKALFDAGFIVPTAGGGYVLGPRFIEFDSQIRESDPLLQVAPPIMTRPSDPLIGAQVLCSFYSDRVMSIFVHKIDKNISLQMERGHPFPLFFGAPSKIIVAYLPTYQLRNLLLNHAEEISKAGLGENWKEFRSKLKELRKAGYCMSGEMNKKIVGVAAPIFCAPNVVAASLCLVRRKEITKPNDIPKLAKLVIEEAARISRDLQAFRPGRRGVAPNFPTARIGR